MTSNQPKIRIDVWSDYVCPFCYLELPVLARLQDELGADLGIAWHAFELRPEPVPTLDPDGDYLHRVWSGSVFPMAEERGMTLKLPPVQPRSRKALEAAEHARRRGRFDEMHEALFRAFFEEGWDIADVSVLTEVAQSVGLERDDLRSALQAGLHTETVLEDERLAQEIGIPGVPAMIVHRADGAGRALMLNGAQPYDAIEATVRRVLSGPSG
jgi:predicted DsbA family dithiol-disulfide isomerase